jgi:dTDP-4-dehydrorhamnose reductase
MGGTALVLGNTGLLGQALMAELTRRGHRAVGVSRAGGVDLACVSTLAQTLDPHKPDLVINAAAITDLAHCERHPADAWLLHARLPSLLAQWADSNGVRWVQVSTDHYFTASGNVLHDELAPVTLLNEYARSKHAGECAALAKPQALVVRTNIVGRRGWAGRPSFAEWAHAALASGEPFNGYTDTWASSMEAGQCAAALLDLVEVGARGLLNVAARESISKAQFIWNLAAATGLSAGAMRASTRPAGGLPRAHTLGLDVTRTEQLLARALPDAREVAQAVARALAFEHEEDHAHA